MTDLEQVGLDAELAAIQAMWENTLEHLQVKSGRVVALHRLAYTWALLADFTAYGYEDRWCYHSYAVALAALEAWSGEPGTEPQGWHRHPDSGRRRPDGDPAREIVNH